MCLKVCISQCAVETKCHVQDNHKVGFHWVIQRSSQQNKTECFGYYKIRPYSAVSTDGEGLLVMASSWSRQGHTISVCCQLCVQLNSFIACSPCALVLYVLLKFCSLLNSKVMHICYRCTCCTYVSAESLTPSYTCKMDQDYCADHTWVQIINGNIVWIVWVIMYGDSIHNTYVTITMLNCMQPSV